MSHTASIPSAQELSRVRDRLVAQAHASGKRPSVLTIARQLGMSNTSFRRHFPDIAAELGQLRRTPAVELADSPAATEHTRLVARNAKLHRENHRLRQHLELAVANLQRLTLDNHQLRHAPESATNVTRVGGRGRIGD